MINYDSILSAFDGKPTLLQWLKIVKKALDESVLKNVDITQNGNNIAFTFNFEDGTSISTPEVTLPKGETGPKGDTGAAGPKGDNGVSITGIDTVGNEVVGDETLTTLRANYSNNTSGEFVVTAKNGKDSGSSIYSHIAYLYDNNHSKYIYFKVYSHKQTLTLDDVLAEIPTVNGSSLTGTYKTDVCFEDTTKNGVVAAGKYLENNNYNIYVSGVVSEGSNVISIGTSFSVAGFGDKLLG